MLQRSRIFSIVTSVFIVAFFIAFIGNADAAYTKLYVAAYGGSEVTYTFGGESRNAAAYEFSVKLFDSDTALWTELLPAYCVDLFHTIAQGQEYTISSFESGGNSEAARLMSYAGVGFNETAAALQSAIWKSVYGNFTLLNSPFDKTSDYEYNQYVWYRSNMPGSAPSTYMVSSFNSNYNPAQTLIVKTGGAPVPEPSTMLLLGCGLVGLAGTARKKIWKS